MKKFLTVAAVISLMTCGFSAYGETTKGPGRPHVVIMPGSDGHGQRNLVEKFLTELGQAAESQNKALWLSLENKLANVLKEEEYAPIWASFKKVFEENKAGLEALLSKIPLKNVKRLVDAFMLGKLYAEWKAKVKEGIDLEILKAHILNWTLLPQPIAATAQMDVSEPIMMSTEVSFATPAE